VLHCRASHGDRQLKTLVLGLGNPILSDDGVGIKVVEEVERRLQREDLVVSQASVGGLGLLDLVAGYDRVIIVDAVQTKNGIPGEVHYLSPDQFHGNVRAASTHDVTFAAALELGKRLHRDMPQEVLILAVEASEVAAFGEELTPEVASVVPHVVELVMEEIGGQSQAGPRH
jgi:hydrogenase maturation protease